VSCSLPGLDGAIRAALLSQAGTCHLRKAHDQECQALHRGALEATIHTRTRPASDRRGPLCGWQPREAREQEARDAGVLQPARRAWRAGASGVLVAAHRASSANTNKRAGDQALQGTIASPPHHEEVSSRCR